MALRWLTAFIDRPADDFRTTMEFWARITGTSLSPARGGDGEFATLVPSDGDAYLRVQRVVSGGGCHLDVHVGDVIATVAKAEELGAAVEHELGGVPVMRSPAGLPFCVVAEQGSATIPSPAAMVEGGPRSVPDQLCIDVPADGYDAECRFWAAFTGWERRPARVAGFSYVVRPPTMPFRLLFQRLGETSPAVVASAHLDFACDDVEQLVGEHERLGAGVVERFEYWTVMADPAGFPYCLLRRPPGTSLPS